MSNAPRRSRSFKTIRRADLSRLLRIALQDHIRFYDEHPRWRRLYRTRRFIVVLAQGAANHYVTGRKGVNDFDVWTFWEANPKAAMPYRRHKVRDFGTPRFGTAASKPHWKGRPVDLLRRSIPRHRNESMPHALIRYLEEGRTETSRRLRDEPVVTLKPAIGRIIWRGLAPASGPPR